MLNLSEKQLKQAEIETNLSLYRINEIKQITNELSFIFENWNYNTKCCKLRKHFPATCNVAFDKNKINTNQPVSFSLSSQPLNIQLSKFLSMSKMTEAFFCQMTEEDIGTIHVSNKLPNSSFEKYKIKVSPVSPDYPNGTYTETRSNSPVQNRKEIMNPWNMRFYLDVRKSEKQITFKYPEFYDRDNNRVFYDMVYSIRGSKFQLNAVKCDKEEKSFCDTILVCCKFATDTKPNTFNIMFDDSKSYPYTFWNEYVAREIYENDQI
jgi:hypothetical protein